MVHMTTLVFCTENPLVHLSVLAHSDLTSRTPALSLNTTQPTHQFAASRGSTTSSSSSTTTTTSTRIMEKSHGQLPASLRNGRGKKEGGPHGHTSRTRRQGAKSPREMHPPQQHANPNTVGSADLQGWAIEHLQLLLGTTDVMDALHQVCVLITTNGQSPTSFGVISPSRVGQVFLVSRTRFTVLLPSPNTGEVVTVLLLPSPRPCPGRKEGTRLVKTVMQWRSLRVPSKSSAATPFGYPKAPQTASRQLR